MAFMKILSENKAPNKTYIKKIKIANCTEDITFIFDKHKSIRLSFSKKGNIVVKIPFWCNEAQAENFIQKKTSWILKKKKDFEILIQNQENAWFYLGNPFELSVKEGKKSIVLGKGFIYISLPKKKSESPKNISHSESFPHIENASLRVDS